MSVQYNNAFSDQFGIPETAGSVIQFGTVGTGIPLEKAISLFKPVIGGVIGGSMTAAQRLTHLKSVLEDNGITNLSGLGNLRIGGNGVNVIPTPGILLPSKDPKGLLGRQVNVAGVTIAEMSGTGGQRNLPTRRTFVIANELKARPLARPVVPHDSVFLSLGVSVAYWVAKEIEISDNTTVVFTSRSKYLYLIAESIKLGSNVQFTWKPPDYRQSIAAIPAPSQPRQTRHPDSDTEVIHGTEQVNVHARNGNDGVHGTDAPAVEIWTLALTGRLVVNFAGQSGQDGQPGQPGNRGQAGANGINGKVKQVFGVGFKCETYPGGGGNGARGGNGGDGGNGGRGGRGGRISFFVPQSVLNDISSDGFYPDVGGGAGGLGGAGGRGGDGGQGGKVGRTASATIPGTSAGIHCGPRSGAKDGRDGTQGRSGERGQDGQAGAHDDDAIHLVAINADDFQGKLTQPAITRIDREVARVGQQISLEGRNFSSTDQVLFNDQVVEATNIQGSTQMSARVPRLDGGRANVLVRQADGTTSNVYTIIIRPHVTAVSQEQASGNRLRPGHLINMHGTGFSSDSLVFANDVELENVQFVSNTELEVQLIRPFQSDELPNPAGEEVAIRVRLPTGTSSSPHMVVLDTFRMVILGDSVQWGQGLQDHQKIHSLVEREIKRRVGDVGVYKKVLAHSGAIIGDDETPTVPPILGEFGGEINVSNPTIREQVLAALGTQASDETVDLVVMNGGINDVQAMNIINPFGSDLQGDIEAFCYGRMKNLLKSVALKFPNAQIITTGYYRIVSDRSDTLFIPLLGAAFGLAIGLTPIVGFGVGLATQEALIDRSRQFRDGAHAAIRRAIADAMAEEPVAVNRISFADPQFTAAESIFAPNAKLFGINLDLTPQDNDVISTGRRQACEDNKPNDFTCPIASIGHPNPAGAQKIANAVIAQLQVGRSQDAMSDDGSEWFRGSDVRRVGHITTNSAMNKQVEYSVLNGRAIFEGDIDLRLSAQMDEFDAAILPQRGVAIVGERFRWPGGVIPYEIDPAYPDPQLILRAIDHWEQYTSLRFSNRTPVNAAQNLDYVRFVSLDGCWSSVGKQGGMQEVSIAPGCGFGTAVHEIGHVAGLWHEQSREDRDKYIRILWQNIVPGMEYNFDQHITDGDDVGEYDTGSIMHYGPRAFSSNGQPTIQSLDNSAIGQRSGLSTGDVAAIESMYGERPITQARPGVQLTAFVPAGATRRWFSGGWPADRNVNWQIVPVAQQNCQPPLLSWTLHADRQALGLVRYYLEVENLCSSDVSFEWRYGLLGQNGNGRGAYDAMLDNAPMADQPLPQTGDGWATASDAGGPPNWLLPEPQEAPRGNGSEYVDAGSPAVLLDPTSVRMQNQPNEESVGSYDRGKSNDQ